jgi:hypothetical protein
MSLEYSGPGGVDGVGNIVCKVMAKSNPKPPIAWLKLVPATLKQAT